MSALKMISPLLDRMAVEKETAAHGSRSCYILRSTSGERFILKRLSVPASDSQVRALILSGAYPDEAAVHEYYGSVVAAIRSELDTGKALSSSGCFAGAVSYQIEPKESGVGYDVYILYPLNIPLNEFLAKNAMTHLRAVNLGIDLCDAISACREAGFLFGNLKPENVFFMQSGKFLLGDLGLVSLQDLEYSCLPEEYIGPFSAPELSDITTAPNTTIDLYSLGMLLYRIYNGNHGPFEDENTGEAMADKLRLTGKPLPTPIYADYELAGIILKACAFQQSERYQTPEELKQALVLYMQRNEVSDTPIAPPIVALSEPVDVSEEDEPQEETPMRMTDAESLDEDFRRSFTPDLTGAGTEADIDPTIVIPPVAPAPKKPVQEKPQEEPAPAAQEAETPAQDAPEAAPAETPAAPEQNDTQQFFPHDEDAEDYDPDQLDLDALLASVNEIVRDVPAEEPPETEQAPAPDAPHDYVDSAAAPDEAVQDEPSGKKHGGKAGKIAIIGVLVLAIAALAYYLITWYYVDVKNLNMLSCTTDRMVVELDSEDSVDRFVLTCTDNYGNAYPGTLDGNRYTFTGLRENTTYTLTVTAAEHHKLSAASTYTLSVTTPESTQITSFTATRGSADGEVLLSFTQEGPAPSRWKLSYADEGGEKKTFEFDGNAYLITGLQQYKRYTFTLESTDTVFLSGQTSVEYELLPIVEAKNLTVSDISGNRVTVTWEPGENVPEEWTLTCSAEGQEDITGTTKENTFTFELPDLSHNYTISISARGMDEPASLVLPSEPIVVDHLTATPNEDGTVTVSWDTPIGEPAGGWYLSYNTVGSVHAAYMPDAENSAISGNSAVLSGLVPNAEYEISLSLTADDSSSNVFGTTRTTFRTAETTVFDEFGVSPAPPLRAASGYISLWLLPEKENWNYNDLRNHKTSFSPEDKIAVCLEINAVNSSTDEVTLLYVVRDSEGRVVNDVSKTLPWNDMWYSRRHASAIPLPAKGTEPSAEGEYRLEIYVNGKLLAETGFTVG